MSESVTTAATPAERVIEMCEAQIERLAAQELAMSRDVREVLRHRPQPHTDEYQVWKNAHDDLLSKRDGCTSRRQLVEQVLALAQCAGSGVQLSVEDHNLLTAPAEEWGHDTSEMLELMKKARGAQMRRLTAAQEWAVAEVERQYEEEAALSNDPARLVPQELVTPDPETPAFWFGVFVGAILALALYALFILFTAP